MDITITMNEAEIVTAIKNFLNTQDVPTAGKDVEVTMVASRGANGHSAVIAIKKEAEVSLLETPDVTPVVNAPDVTPVIPEVVTSKATKANGGKKTGAAPTVVIEPTPPVTESLFDENNISEGQSPEPQVNSLFEDEEIVDPELTEEERAAAISGSLFE